MKVKDILSKIASLSVVLGMASCSGWLDEDPKSQINLNNFTGQTAMEALLTGSYTSLRSGYNLGSNIGVVGTDICMTQKTNASVAPFEYYAFSSSTGVIQNAWQNAYANIRDCNVTIDRTQVDPETPEAAKRSIIGQARFIRAFSYFKLVQRFGPLPLMVSETLEYDEFILNASRRPIREVYDLIVSDLLYASSAGVLSETVSDGRATRYAAKGLLAKVYLTMGTSKARQDHDAGLAQHPELAQYADLALPPQEYYKLCYNLCLEVMNSGKFKLVDTYGDLFSIDASLKNTNGESMWEIQFSTQRDYGSAWSKSFGLNGDGGMVHTYNAMSGQRWYQPVSSFWTYYKKGDLRLSWNLTDRGIKYPGNDEFQEPYWRARNLTVDTDDPTILRSVFESTAFNNNVSCTKYRWGSGDPDRMWSQKMIFGADNCPNNVIVLRYADVLLMFAEADMLLNGASPADLSSTGASAAALEAVNSILYRARGNKTQEQMLDYATDTWGSYVYDSQGNPVAVEEFMKSRYMYDYNNTDNPLTFGELMRERARELCFEFHRWYDLSRWGLLKQMVNTTDRIYLTTLVRPEVLDKHYLFPIPQTELEASYNKTGFYQNTGY